MTDGIHQKLTLSLDPGFANSQIQTLFQHSII